MVCYQGRDEGNPWGGVSNKRAKFKFFGLQEEPRTPIPSYSATSWFPHKENPEESAWSAYGNDFENNELEYFLSKQQNYNM